MAGLFPLAGVHQLRRLHLGIIGSVEPTAHIGFQLAPQHEAVGMPEHRSLRFGLEVEQVHLLPDLAMIALGGFLQPEQMLVELLLVEPAGAVDAAQHRILLVAAPIGAGDARQFEGIRIQPPGRGHMRPAAHIEPRALAIDRQFLALGQFGGPFGLERLALRAPRVDQLLTRPDFARERFVPRDDTAHLRLDRGQVVIGERAIPGGEIVIEAIVGRRAEGDLRAGEQMLHRLRHDVREIVAGQFERIRLVTRRHQRQRGVVRQRAGKIAQLAVHPRRDRRLGKPRADRGGDVRRRGAMSDLSHRTVGQCDREHFHRRHSYADRDRGVLAAASGEVSDRVEIRAGIGVGTLDPPAIRVGGGASGGDAVADPRTRRGGGSERDREQGQPHRVAL